MLKVSKYLTKGRNCNNCRREKLFILFPALVIKSILFWAGNISAQTFLYIRLSNEII